METFTQMQARIPERIIEKAVKGMLPKGRLGRTLFTHMKVRERERERDSRSHCALCVLGCVLSRERRRALNRTTTARLVCFTNAQVLWLDPWQVIAGPEHPHSAQQPVDITSQIDKSYRTQKK